MLSQVSTESACMRLQAASNVQIGKLNLPSEVHFNILGFLNPLDLGSIPSINLFCGDLFDKESVWISKAKLVFKVKVEVEESFLPHNIYQHGLHKFGPMLKLWQRQKSRFSGINRVVYEDKAVVFENLVPTQDNYSDLDRLMFLTAENI